MWVRCANYIFNIGSIVGMLVLATVIGGLTAWAVESRDDSALVWEDSCTISEMLLEDGDIELRCHPSDVEVVLTSSRDAFISLVGNTPISERATVPAICRNYQSGRWICRIGEDEEFYRFRDATPQDEA